MREFIRHFIREQHGTWRCVEAAEFKLDGGRMQVAPGTRFTRGTTFMGIDLAARLDAEYEHQHEHATRP